MSKNANDLIRATSRTDSVKKTGDMFTGDGNAVPSRDPIFLPPTLGQSGDMVSGAGPATPDTPPIEKLNDPRSTLPVPGRQT
jgi:hypothetical protein